VEARYEEPPFVGVEIAQKSDHASQRRSDLARHFRQDAFRFGAGTFEPAGTSHSKTATELFEASPSTRKRIANCPDPDLFTCGDGHDYCPLQSIVMEVDTGSKDDVPSSPVPWTVAGLAGGARVVPRMPYLLDCGSRGNDILPDVDTNYNVSVSQEGPKFAS